MTVSSTARQRGSCRHVSRGGGGGGGVSSDTHYPSTSPMQPQNTRRAEPISKSATHKKSPRCAQRADDPKPECGRERMVPHETP